MNNNIICPRPRRRRVLFEIFNVQRDPKGAMGERIQCFLNDIELLEELERCFQETAICQTILIYDRELCIAETCERMSTHPDTAYEEMIESPLCARIQAAAFVSIKDTLHLWSHEVYQMIIANAVIDAIRYHHSDRNVLINALPVLEGTLVDVDTQGEHLWKKFTNHDVDERMMLSMLPAIKAGLKDLQENMENRIKPARQQLAFLVADMERLNERSIQLLGEKNRLADVSNVLCNRAAKAMRFVTEDANRISVLSHIVDEVQRIGSRALNLSLPSVLCITNKLRENMGYLLQLGEKRQGSEASFIAVLEEFLARSRNALVSPTSPELISYCRLLSLSDDLADNIDDAFFQVALMYWLNHPDLSD